MSNSVMVLVMCRKHTNTVTQTVALSLSRNALSMPNSRLCVNNRFELTNTSIEGVALSALQLIRSESTLATNTITLTAALSATINP